MTKKPGAARKAVTLALLAVLLAVFGRMAWSRWGQLGAPAAKLESRYHTEEQWIAAEIVQDIAEMAAFAAEPATRLDASNFSVEALPPGGTAPGVRVAFSATGRRRIEQDVRWTHHIWAPEDYAELARAVLGSQRGRGGDPAADTDEMLLTALLAPRARVLDTQSQRVSDRLKRAMLDAEAHEEAALVVGALALREAAGRFWDARQLLCRMTAHLALAAALRDGALPGLDGRYAAVILSILSGRTKEAMASLDGLRESAGTSETQAAWQRALRLNVTADWRAMPDPPQRTLLERIQYFEAVTATVGGATAWQFLQTREPEPVADWSRHAFQSWTGTEVGAFMAAEPDVEEAREIWTRIHGRPMTADLNEELNRPAERCITADGPRVLSWGTWAASLQRHICNRMLETERYLRFVLGQPDRAQGALADYERRWGRLLLYPFVPGLRWHYGGIELESFADGVTAAVRTAATRPELIEASLWIPMQFTTKYAVTRKKMPDPKAWFAYPAPAGTAYGTYARLEALGLGPGGSASLQLLHERHPWSYDVARRTVLERFGKRPTPAQIREVFGSRVDYDSYLLGWSAEGAEPRSPERRQLLEARCDLLAARCIDLARYLVALGQDDEAARALRRAFDTAYERVYVANTTRFLVRYYHERNQPDEATRVAEDAADTGSGAGLETMALLLEWRDKVEDAEDYFTRIERAYGQNDSLVAFYHRMGQKGRADYQARFDRLIREEFPAGLEKLDPQRLPSSPTDGVVLTSPGGEADVVDLKDGDIVVGLDGWRIHNIEQYGAVEALEPKAPLRLYLWRKGQYAEREIRVMNRYLPLNLQTYPSMPPR